MIETQSHIVPIGAFETKQTARDVQDTGIHPFQALISRVLEEGCSKTVQKFETFGQAGRPLIETPREEKRRRWGSLQDYQENRGVLSMEAVIDNFCTQILEKVNGQDPVMQMLNLGKCYEEEKEKIINAVEWIKDDIRPGDMACFQRYEQAKEFGRILQEQVRIKMQVLCDRLLRDPKFDQMMKATDEEEFKRQTTMQSLTNNFYNVNNCSNCNIGSQQNANTGEANYAGRDINEYAAAPPVPANAAASDDATPPGTPPKKGAPERHLFTKGGQKDEDTTERMVGKFLKCLNCLNIHSQQVSTQQDELNKAVLCFVRWCDNKHFCENAPTGAAVARFIIDDCGMKRSVVDKAYSDFIGRQLKNKDYDSELYAKIAKLCA